MTQQPHPADSPPALPALKIAEPEVDADDPWGDDVLDRKEIADRLTSIVRGQEAPFVISIDGRWGTGKTFLLKRWARDLEKQGWQAIYYNAWEDDFADDPLLAIIAQLSEHLGQSFGDRVSKLVDVAGPLLYYGASIAALASTGIPLPPIPAGSNDSPSEKLDAYQAKRVAKDDLRGVLTRLASEVRDDTGQPLVFIIDELDRCRPTFAIELLERVKHIFDVPNIVFVFGINRAELVKSLKSVYGDIDAEEYLLRFFDMGFTLPDADPAQFCKHLIAKFQLTEFFTGVDQNLRISHYGQEIKDIDSFLPFVLGRMGLSLRDMDYCVRLVALGARESLNRKRLYAPLLVLLAATKLRNPELYRRFVQGEARGADLINHLNEQRPEWEPIVQPGTEATSLLKWLEAAAYYADDPNRALGQLKRLKTDGEEMDQPEYVSADLAELDFGDKENTRRLDDIIRIIEERHRLLDGYTGARRSLAETIDIYTDFVRR